MRSVKVALSSSRHVMGWASEIAFCANHAIRSNETMPCPGSIVLRRRWLPKVLPISDRLEKTSRTPWG